ncbi:MAG: hypothetical protein RLZ55_834, partial [Actinomycetota bacterium]
AVVDNVKGRSRVAWLTFSQSVPLSVEGAVVVAAVGDAGAVAHFNRAAYPEIVSEAMLEVLRHQLRLDLIHDPGRAAAGAPAAGKAQANPGGAPAAPRQPQPAGPAAPAETAPPAPVPPTAADAELPPYTEEDEALADSTDVMAGLTGEALIEAALGGRKIDEFEE